MTGKAQFALIIVLVGIMVIFTIVGLASGHVAPENYKPFAPFGGKGIWLAVCAGTYAYMEPLSLLSTAGEVKNIKILPKAMFWAFITIILLYAAAILVCLGLVIIRNTPQWHHHSQSQQNMCLAAQQVWY